MLPAAKFREEGEIVPKSSLEEGDLPFRTLTPSLLEKGASSVLPSYFRLGRLPGLVHGKISEAWLENQRFNPTQAYDDI